MTLKDIREMAEEHDFSETNPVAILLPDGTQVEPTGLYLLNGKIVIATPKRADPIAALPWKREREGKPGDRFERGDCLVTVTGHSDGRVYYTSRRGTSEPRRSDVAVEQWHEAIAAMMDGGAVFTPVA